jgi:hypothetical protein
VAPALVPVAEGQEIFSTQSEVGHNGRGSHLSYCTNGAFRGSLLLLRNTGTSCQCHPPTMRDTRLPADKRGNGDNESLIDLYGVPEKSQSAPGPSAQILGLLRCGAFPARQHQIEYHADDAGQPDSLQRKLAGVKGHAADAEDQDKGDDG